MIIESLDLKNYRNYDILNMNFDKNVNIIYGDNAQGKTNILESIYFCATSKSHRGSKDKDIVKFGESESHIKANVIKNDISYRIDMHLKSNKPKGIAVNGIPIKKAVDLFGIINVVLFSPEDLNIIKDGPSQRRRFMDMELSQLNKIYLSNLVNFNKVLGQRNKLLKELEQYDQTNAVKLNMNVYQQKPTKTTKDSVDFTDQAYRYTIETNGSYIYQYEPLHTANLTNDLLFSTEWEIKDSQLSKNELTFSAILPKTLSPEEVTSLLNELADEMIRYNFKNTEKASATIQSEISDTETYYYLSEQPNYLIYKTRLIG